MLNVQPPQSLLYKLALVECKLLKETDKQLWVSRTGLVEDMHKLPKWACRIEKRNHHDIINLSVPRDLAVARGLIDG